MIYSFEPKFKKKFYYFEWGVDTKICHFLANILKVAFNKKMACSKFETLQMCIFSVNSSEKWFIFWKRKT